MFRRILTSLAVLLFGALAFSQSKPSDLPKLERFDPSLIDHDKNPCDSFYEYTCSKWIAAHPISPDLPVTGTAVPLFLYNQTVLRDAMEKAAANKQATGGERQVSDFWQSCMNEELRNAKSRAWLEPFLTQVDSMKSKRDLPRVLAYLHLNLTPVWEGDDNSTKAAFFGMGPQQDYADATQMVPQIDQGGMALPSIDYYTDPAGHFKDIREKYVAHVQKMFELAGDSPQQASAQAGTVMEMETAFAKASMDNVTRRDPAKVYNKRTLAELKTATPDFDWNEYLKAMGVPSSAFYIVTAPSFLPALEQQIQSRSVGDLRAYLRWWTIHEAASHLGNEFEEANFAFFATVLAGTPEMLPRWRRCVGAGDYYIGQGPLGEQYVKIAFPPEAKRRADELVSRIRAALQSELANNDWMSPATRKQAVEKQEATLQKIGYPAKWRDYSSVKFTADNFLANASAANAFEAHRQIHLIGLPVDRQQWDMTPPTINAYENPQMNTLNFPAGILQMPFFSPEQDDVMNYGAIGMVIGHEATHGFDDEGRKFDAKGNLRDWWTPEDAKRYEEKDQCIVDQYTAEIPQYGVKQNGKLTAGEDTADNGGIHLAMLALEGLYKDSGKSLDAPAADGLTPRQRFFLSYGFSWCEELRPELARQQVTTNPHSIPQFRVDRPLSNMSEFQQAFGCKNGQAMVHVPQCRVW